MDERSGCAEIRELLPELAAGVAAGDERARVLRHLNGCFDCRRELAAMALVVDELVALTPPAEPPAGFESAVLAKIRPARRRWWRRWAPRLAVTAATVLLAAAAGAGIAMRATADERRIAKAYERTLKVANGRYITARPLTAPGGSRTGTAFAYQGTPSWVFLVVWPGGVSTGTGAYDVRLVTVDGRDRPIGRLDVAGGEGSWGVVIDTDVPQIAAIRLAGPAGPPLTAAFR